MREVRPVVSTKAVRDHASLGLIPGLQVVNRSAELCAHCRQHGPEQERVLERGEELGAVLGVLVPGGHLALEPRQVVTWH